MEKITIYTKAEEIEALKKYSKYLCFRAGAEKPFTAYPLRELQEMFPAWNAKAIAAGLRCAAREARRQEILFDVYSEEECAGDPQKRDVKLWYLPAEGGEKKPFILFNAGGCYQTVCTMVEAFPAAVHFRKMGYPVFCLNYRVEEAGTLPKPLDDLAAAYRYIIAHKEKFGIEGEEYAVGGFSAGGNLTCLWGTEGRGYKSYRLPKPIALFPIYPVVSRDLQYMGMGNVLMTAMFGENRGSEEFMDSLEVGKLVTEEYPPCYIVHCADDSSVPAANAVFLKKLLEEKEIPVKLELGLIGEHGFGDGTGTDVEGWPERAAAFLESLRC